MEHPIARAARVRAFLPLLAALCLGIVALPAYAQLEIKLGHVGEPGSLFDKSAEEFAKRANAKLEGKAKVVVYGSSQLGGDKEMLQKLKLGTLDMALPSTVMSSRGRPVRHLRDALHRQGPRAHAPDREGDLLADARARDREEGAQGAGGLGERLPPDHQQQASDPGARPTCRASSSACPQGKWRVKMFEAYGANPSPMKFSELFTALQTGVMDGEENPFTQIYSAKLQEVQKYLSLSGHVYTPAYLTVGTSNGRRCRPTCARSSRTRPRRRRPTSTRRPRAGRDRPARASSRQAGMQVNDVDKDAFVAASKPIYDGVRRGSARRQGADRSRRRAAASDRGRGVHADRAATASAARRFRAAYGRFLEWVVVALMVVLVGRGHARRRVPHDPDTRSTGTTRSRRCCSPGSRSTAPRWRRCKRAHIGCPELVERAAVALARAVGHRRPAARHRVLRAPGRGRRVDPADARDATR